MISETGDRVEIKGTVEDVSVHIEGTGFTVLEIEADDEFVTVVGVLPEVSPGEELTLTGVWSTHPTYGKQFRADGCMRSLPASSGDLLKYLSAGTVRGIGPVTARKIIEKFGDSSFEVLENEPQRLAQIKGISLNKAKEISAEFKNQFAIREVMIALEKYGMKPFECVRVYKAFGVRAVETISRNPYLLCGSGVGIGFDRADAIAAMLPEPPDKLLRIKAGLLHIVRHNLSNGHTCLPREKLAVPAGELLDADSNSITEAVDALIEEKQLISRRLIEREFVFLPKIYSAELSAAKRIGVLCSFPPPGKPTLVEDIAKLEKDLGIKYEAKQRLAITTAVEKGVLILTGGPGTGKTTAINGILELFERDKLRVQLAAPTGRAAKRMSEITGREAKTIHRLLEVEWDERDEPVFTRNVKNPIEADALIVDELSMVDITVFASLLDALPLGCRLIMVGDADQLPPVGAGNVLHDLIESGLLPVVALTEVFRQASESLIVINAHKIVRGEKPELNCTDKDFFFMQRNSAIGVVRTVCELCSQRLPTAYGYSPTEDIQVLCPSRKGEAGTINLNRRLQEVLNEPDSSKKKELSVAGKLFREGDKVMQTKNNYDIVWERNDGSFGEGVFNGDIGKITVINPEKGEITIDFDGRLSSYSPELMQDVELAYAVTVHKSQGNEFPAVILPVFSVPEPLCYRNLLYTAVTRARSLLISVGSEGQLLRMAENDKKARRYSALKYFLNGD